MQESSDAGIFGKFPEVPFGETPDGLCEGIDEENIEGTLEGILEIILEGISATTPGMIPERIFRGLSEGNSKEILLHS